MNRNFFCVILCVFLLVLSSCDFSDESAGSVARKKKVQEKWTFVVYMAADNDLESSAISDLNEMENALDFFSTASNVLVLLDRAVGNDATNGDWTDTRLFQVKADKSSAKSTIVSKRLDCPELALGKDSESELDMADSNVLGDVLKFARRMFPADRYGLVIWGHGNGWRAETSAADSSLVKAVAKDVYSDSYMTIPSLRAGIERGMDGGKLDFIGFDTCFGACVELAYELCDSALVMAGTPALVPSTGWNYTTLLNSISSTEMSVKDVYCAVLEQFKGEYSSYPYASFSVVDLSKIKETVALFNDFASFAARKITTATKRNTFEEICLKNVRAYCATTYPCDYFLDIRDFAEKIVAKEKTSAESGNRFLSALDGAILGSWSADENPCSLGLFYSQFEAYGSPSPKHDEAYVNGSRITDLSRFVMDADGYVPTVAQSGSFLDQIFYKTY